MPDKRKREKVVAEVSISHLMQFAGEIGRGMSHEEAVTFLNQDGRAYAMWKRMMQAAEEYMKARLNQQRPASISRRDTHRTRLLV